MIRFRMASLGAVIVLSAVVVLAACGGGGNGVDGSGDGAAPTPTDATDAGGGAAAVDTCELLTTDEVEAAVGNPVEDGATDIVPGVCDWASGPDDTSVSVSLRAGPTKQQCDAALAADPSNEVADGFDDPAFWSYVPASGGVGSIVACTDQGQLQVTVNGGLDDPEDEARLRTAAEDLTTKALDRL